MLMHLKIVTIFQPLKVCLFKYQKQILEEKNSSALK
jgi:hypothetical protein